MFLFYSWCQHITKTKAYDEMIAQTCAIMSAEPKP